MLRKKSNITKIYSLILFIILIFNALMLSNSIKYNSTTDTLYDDTIDLYDLKFSGQQINITTPENKTYYSPMSGYYPGTYGFENDEVDSVPFGWTDESGGPTWVKVIASEDGHNNVLQLYDTTGGDPYAINAIGNKEYGTVEFWMKNVDMTEKAYFAPRNGATHLFRVLLADNMVIVTAQGGTAYDLAAATADTWHHFSVDFECGTGGYKGLGQYEFSVTYNGMRYGPYNFWNNAPYANNTAFSGFYGSGNYYYVDAVGYSWDPDYSIGDNMYEGLLLSINTGFTPDWLGYSLDSQTNKTILGNSTISFPSEAFHTTQVFGNDSLGTMYQSDIRHFTTKFFNIITPENKTYIEPMSGYYPATYGFENDMSGGSPDEWILVEDGGSVNVQDSLDVHNKVLRFYDTSTADGVNARNQFVNQTTGTIEWWVKKTSGSTSCFFIFHGGTEYGAATRAIEMAIDSGDNGAFGIRDGVPYVYDYSYSDNTWYHLKVEFDCINHNFTVYKNGAPMFENAAFLNEMDEINLMEIGTNSFRAGTFYTDAIGYSWAPNYNIGNNLDEGLLVSFDLGFSPDWLGYSLDSQTNKTILGNTTIPLPSEGLHTIQVFGNDSLNAIYESELRYFSIDLPPIIIINKPSQNDLFGLIAPSFNISIIESYLNETWYTIDGGLTNYTFSGLIGTINQTTAWDNENSGPITIRFYANDSAGNVGFEDIIVFKDTSAPIIAINIPDENEFYAGTPPNFDITIDELSLNITWYTLDNGVNNFTFIGLTGSINQAEWDKQGEGPVILRFYANDSFGYQNYNEITIHKDITDPVLTIYSPTTGDRFTTIPPAFNIEVNETNLESIWYTIDGGLNNYDITQLTGFIDSTAWNAAPTGAITIRFYIEDKAGNVVYTDIVVQKMSPPTPLDFNLVIIIATILLIIGIVVVGGLVYRRKHVRIRIPKPIVEKVEKTEEKKTKQKRRRREKIIEPQIINCPFCQAELPGDQKFCFYCGAKLKD